MKAIYDRKSARIGVDKWEFPEMTHTIEQAIKSTIRTALELATNDYECSAWFPWEWKTGEADESGRKFPDDPTTIYVELPLGPNDDDSPRWSFALSDLVKSFIELHEHGPGGRLDPEMRKPAIAVRDSLRKLADMLDAQIPPE